MPNKTSSKPHLQLRDTTIQFIDPGINCTGIAIIHIDSKGNRTPCSLMKSKPDENDTTQRRLQHVWETAIVQQDHFHVDQVVMEEPPETVYGGGKGFGANYNIGRATKLFKTFAVAHAVLAATVASHPRIKVYTVLPVQWQPSKKARGGLSTKEWSLRYANLILAKHGNGGDLHTEDDENIADALAMGWILTNPDLQCKV